MASFPKHINHELGPMTCPVDLDSVDLFGDGAQEHWYEAYEILHRDAPVLRIEGGGLTAGTDAFVLTKHADVTMVVKDPVRFPSLGQARLGAFADQGMSAEDTYASYHNLMQVSMVSLRGPAVVRAPRHVRAVAPRSSQGACVHRGGDADALADSRTLDPCHHSGRSVPERHGSDGSNPTARPTIAVASSPSRTRHSSPATTSKVTTSESW